MALFTNPVKKHITKYTKLIDSEFISVCNHYNAFYKEVKLWNDKDKVTNAYNKMYHNCTNFNELINTLKDKFILANCNIIGQFSVKLLTEEEIERDGAFEAYRKIKSSSKVFDIKTKRIIKYIEKHQLDILIRFDDYLTEMQNELNKILKIAKFEYNVTLSSCK